MTGHGVGIAMALVVAGTTLAVAYGASDGALFNQLVPPKSSEAASNNGQNDPRVAGNDPLTSNVSKVEPESAGDAVPVMPGVSATTSEEAPAPKPENSVNAMSDEEMQKLLAIKEFPWEQLSARNATSAEVQSLVDELVGSGQDARKLHTSTQMSAELTSGMALATNSGALVRVEPIIGQDNDGAAFSIAKEPAPRSSEVAGMEQQPPHVQIRIPEDGRELQEIIEDILGVQENDEDENEDDSEDDGGTGPDEGNEKNKHNKGKGKK